MYIYIYVIISYTIMHIHTIIYIYIYIYICGAPVVDAVHDPGAGLRRHGDAQAWAEIIYYNI